MNKLLEIKFILLLTAILFLVMIYSVPHQLFFVDSARYADVARNLVSGGGYTSSFSFTPFEPPSQWGWRSSLPYIHTIFIALFYKIFDIGDLAVILESVFFFLAGVPLVYLIGKKLFNNRVALFSSLFYLFTPQLLNFAKDGASEPIFILELLLITYLVLRGDKKDIILASIVSVIALFTKLQSVIFIPIFLLWVLLISQNKIKDIALYISFPIFGILLIQLGVIPSILSLDRLPIFLFLQQSSLYPGDSLPRSGTAEKMPFSFFIENFKVIFSKALYNIYNFYKIIFSFESTLPRFAPPLIVITFILSLFTLLANEKKQTKVFRLIVLLMVLVSVLLASVTSPHIRYVQITLPFIILTSVDLLNQTFEKLLSKQADVYKSLALTLIIFFIVPFVGSVILDSRFSRDNFNTEKPFAHKQLGITLGSLTNKEDIVITNIDTWGSWYGMRRTILIPSGLDGIKNLDKSMGISAIFLSDFQRDNTDHPLTGEWGVMFDTPEKISDQYILDNFELEKVASFSSQEVYENKPFTYKLWIKK